jgi:hypothetical protein
VVEDIRPSGHTAWWLAAMVWAALVLVALAFNRGHVTAPAAAGAVT